MKTTARIARLELSTLFYSPIAWFLLVIFLFQCGLEYTSQLERVLLTQEMGSYPQYMKFLTAKMFSPQFGLFSGIMEKLYLYLPLLTMGMMSRETSSGTIKLLYSSPVKLRSIIFGKFLALMIYDGLLTLMLGIITVAASIHIHTADYGILLSGLFAMYLLLCAYSAIGLFMSCLTSYQVVAAISTLVLFAVLDYIGTLWQDIDLVRDLTYFLSISGRTSNMLYGLISSKDVIYFAVIVYIFLGLSILKLTAARESRSAWIKGGRYAGVILTALVIGYVTSRPALTGYYDATATKTNTLTANSRKIIEEMNEGPLEVVSYINLLDRRYGWGRPEQRNSDLARWEPYLRYKHDIRFKYIYYYDSVPDPRLYKTHQGQSLDSIADKYALSYRTDIKDFKTPAAIRRMIDLRPEQNRYVMQLHYKGKATFLRLFDDIQVYPSETETSAALRRLTSQLPVIAFWQGENERNPDKQGDQDYQMITSEVSFRLSMVNQGFNVIRVFAGEEIPGNVAALIIADPKLAFSDLAGATIKRYIASGGNLLIAAEPGKAKILNPILEPLGVQLKAGMLVQESADYAPNLILPDLTRSATELSGALADAGSDSIKVAMPGAVGLSYTLNGSFDIRPLLMSDANHAWSKPQALPADSTAVVFSAGSGDEKGPIPTAIRLTRNINGKEQRIVVTGDADFMSTAEMGRRNIKTANLVFNTALFSWFTHDQFPINTDRPKSLDTRLALSHNGPTGVKVLLLGILPGAILLAGAVLLIRRKRR